MALTGNELVTVVAVSATGGPAATTETVTTQAIANLGGGGGAGTVTSVSVASANGLAGTVATATTTPAITLSTSITGVLKGNGTAISAATAGTDYLAPNGDGSALTNLNASNLASGTVPGARLGAIGSTYAGDTVTVAQTITLISYAPYAFTINSLRNLATISGTVTGTLNINGSPVTGCSSLSLTSTPQTGTATAANTVAVGNSVTFVTTSPSSLTGLAAFGLVGTRT